MKVITATDDAVQAVRPLLGRICRDETRPGDIKKWEADLKHSDPDLYSIYEDGIASGLLAWREEQQPYHLPNQRSWSVNAYRSGKRGQDALIKYPCWVLRLAREKTQKQQQKEQQDFLNLMKVHPQEKQNYKRLRYCYSHYSNKFSDWERSFVINIGSWLTDGKRLSYGQRQSIDKIFAKYKIPLDAEA